MGSNGVSLDASFDSTIASQSTRKSKSGLKKLGSSIKNVFGGKKRRRRRKKTSETIDDQSYGSYDHSDAGDSAIYSYQEVSSVHSKKRISDTNTNTTTNMNNMPSMGLSRITEGHNEDASDVEDFSPRRSRERNPFKAGGRRGGGDGSSVSSKGSWRGNRRSSKKSPSSQPADPLSLVVLLIDPSSLRFELLSLDFDLAASTSTSTTTKRSTKNAPSELTLTVRDVLNQITPETLTEEKLKASASKSGGCRALIDRKGQIHFGTASLEKACAARPLRAVDRALEVRAQVEASSNGRNRIANGTTEPGKQECLLSIPTYGGEPHRDVLLGFFDATGDDNGKQKKEKTITEMANDLAQALDLARPIFADPNVVNLMESNGYDLTGWKAGTSVDTPTHGTNTNININDPSNKRALSSTSRALLLPPIPSPQKSRRWNFNSPTAKFAIALVSVALATVLAFALVSGGLHMMPAISSSDANGDDVYENDGPQTFEGYVRLAFDYVWSRYGYGSRYSAEKGADGFETAQLEYSKAPAPAPAFL